MKIFIFLSLFYLITDGAFGEVKSDSGAYQLQRKKINSMLAQRKQKFGRYDESLNMHTGIFGFQTKKDIRRSNDILMDIVKTDDNIYKELKILLDFRAFQQTQVQTQSKDAEESNIGFMVTINKLRAQSDQLKADMTRQQHQHDRIKQLFVIIVILMLASILYLLTRKNKLKV